MAKKVYRDGYQNPKYSLSVRDLAIIAVLCSLGGVMSTYVKYIANMINIFFGVPFGAAQLVAGLHIFWLVLCFGLVRKLGTGTLAGFLKGVIELFTGNPHGVIIVLISGIEGTFLDLGMAAFKKKHAIYSYGISGGLAAWAEVFVFYPLYFSGMSIWIVIATSLIAFGSGVVFGGFFGTGTLELLHQSKVARIPNWQPTGASNTYSNHHGTIKTRFSRLRAKTFYIASIIFILFFAIGGLAYFITVQPMLKESSVQCEVTGAVEKPYTYDPKDFTDDELTIKTELVGSFQAEGEKEYTGVPLYVIINHSQPKQSISEIVVIGSDGYKIPFEWGRIQNDDRLILIQEDDSLRLIAGDYDLSYSVRKVMRIEVL
ncbi:ECF transporter S component [[Eubacterium] cellulosolvens]